MEIRCVWAFLLCRMTWNVWNSETKVCIYVSFLFENVEERIRKYIHINFINSTKRTFPLPALLENENAIIIFKLNSMERFPSKYVNLRNKFKYLYWNDYTVYEKHHPQMQPILCANFNNDMSIKWCIEKRDKKIEHLNSTKYRIQGIKWN